MNGELDAEREITCETIEAIGMRPLVFEKNAGVLNPLYESLNLVEKSNIVCLILWKKFSEVVVKEYEKAVRLGIPIIILDKKLERDESRDDELTKFSKQIQCTYKHFRRLSELRSELVNRLQHVIAEVFINTIRRLPHEGFDTRIKQSLKTAKKVYILSRTPILLFGPRPYLSENKHPDEAEGYELTKQLMEDAISGDLPPKNCASCN